MQILARKLFKDEIKPLSDEIYEKVVRFINKGVKTQSPFKDTSVPKMIADTNREKIEKEKYLELKNDQ